MDPNTTQLILFSLVAAFLVALLFIPTFAITISDVLRRHAQAVSAAYDAYREQWNAGREA